MKYAILSDIHANLHAWNAVKDDMELEGVEAVVCLGDIIGYGPRPVETLDSVCSSSNYIVLGNHEAVIEGSFDRSQFNDEAWKMIDWTGNQLSPDDGKFFEQLPLVIEMDSGTSKILFVHGTSFQPESFSYIIETESAMEAWNACDADIIFAGHTHETAIFMLKEGHVSKRKVADFSIKPGRRYIVNVGSVGMPRETDFRAGYCIFDTDSGQISFKKVSYDFEAFRKDVLDIIGESEQSRHVLSCFKGSQHKPIKEQLDFVPSTVSQILSRQMVFREKMSVRADGMPPPRQFRLNRAAIGTAKEVKSKSSRKHPGINKKLWFSICGFFLMIAIAATLVAIFIPPPKAIPIETAGKEEPAAVGAATAENKTEVSDRKTEPAPTPEVKPVETKGISLPKRKEIIPVAPSTVGVRLETNFGNGSKYIKVSGQDNSSLPEGWRESSAWGDPMCSYSFQPEVDGGFLKCDGAAKGRMLIYHEFNGLAPGKTFKITLKVKGTAKSEVYVAFGALEKPWNVYDNAALRLPGDWKDVTTMLTCGQVPANTPSGFMIYARSPGAFGIMSVKVEEISFLMR
ncbi:MAG TPA: hypothetical protein DCZ94_13935 [Lentisphaeria bacterium]|nr:MAG: hypothetical protein A2X48_03755 [Lentisphaerae bacterium GWF2_49_21]HBC88045.1 hypothetical protein [Lentisphaeria bacterium]